MLGNLAIPIDGFTETGIGDRYAPKGTNEHHNVATAAYRPGTIIEYYNERLDGYGACIYLKYDSGAGPVAAAAGLVATLYIRAEDHYTVTCDSSDGILGGKAALCLSVITDTYYGWFWCKGVCPDINIAADSSYAENADLTTDGDVAAGEVIMASTDGVVDTYAGTNAGLPLGQTLAADTGTDLAAENVYLFPMWG